MDKNAIKKYAVWARSELIFRISQKAEYYGVTSKSYGDINADSIDGRVLSVTEKLQRQALIKKIAEEGYEQAIEEVAYTGFNRFTALRYMEVNNYLPSRTRVFTNAEGEFKPQIIDEAINVEIDGLDKEKVYTYKETNETEALYRYLLITQCNALNKIMPVMFQKIEDYTELLLPDYLLREGSVIEQMVTQIPEEDWKDQVQIIGWLYQYYNAEKKDEVFAALKKNVKITKENIPAATQLFTPDWIVRYMVENSLGRLWTEGHPNNEIKQEWKYYIEEAKQEEEVEAQLVKTRKEYASIKPEEILCIDPCAGSGHILDYIFDVLMQIYTDYGYSATEAVRSIIENNLYGLDIDDRAAQLAYFSVMMKARSYDRRFLTRKDENGQPDIPQPHVYAIEESNGLSKQWTANGQLKTLFDVMKDAKEYGSIITVPQMDFASLREFVSGEYLNVGEQINVEKTQMQAEQEKVIALINVAEALSQKYDVVCTNPPYMGNKGFSSKLLKFIIDRYYECKIDLYAVFVNRCNDFITPNGFYSIITPDSWMFVSRFEKMRIPFLEKNSFITIAHFGLKAFDCGFGTAAFCATKKISDFYKTNCHRLVNYSTAEEKRQILISTKPFTSNAALFGEVTGSPICYWASRKIVDAFKNKSIYDMGNTCVGLVTGNNERFIRNWYEIDYSLFGVEIEREIAIKSESLKWFPINQCGDYRKWYGNNITVFDWWHNGYNIKKYKMDRYLNGETEKKNSKCWNEDTYFKEGLTWNRISTDRFSARYSERGNTAGTTCPMYFNENNKYYILALLNSKVIANMVNFLNPTVSF